MNNPKTKTSTLGIFIALVAFLVGGTVITIASQAEPYTTPTANVASSKPSESARGFASYYSYTLASGWYSGNHFVCASRDYPRGTKLVVRYKNTGVVCVVTDTGPNVNVFPNRIVDLSPRAFQVLAPLRLGVISVEVSRL